MYLLKNALTNLVTNRIRNLIIFLITTAVFCAMFLSFSVLDTANAIIGEHIALYGISTPVESTPENNIKTPIRANDRTSMPRDTTPDYSALIKPTENLRDVAQVFVAVIFTIGTLVLILTHIICIAERKSERFTLRSLGLTRLSLIRSFSYEIITLSFIAFFIAGITSHFLSTPLFTFITS